MALEKVRVSAAINPPILLVDYSHRCRLNGKAVVRVRAPSPAKGHGPIDLVALLDVSHNMNSMAPAPEEAPSKLDLLKKAMKFMARQLDDDDRLAIVAFNDQVIKEHTTDILEASDGGRMAIEKKVDGLMAKGDTAFRPGLEHAVKLLDDRADKKRVGFIILISDGLDKSQFQWSDESVAAADPVRGLLRKYPVHTLGLPKADPKALHFIAKESYGTYSCIAGDDTEKNMMEALAVCIAGLKTVVAVDTVVDITSSSLDITTVNSGGYVRRGASGGFLIGTLCAGEVKDLVVHFGYTTGSWDRGYYTVLSGITARVTCRDVPGGQSSTSTDNCSVSLAVHTTMGSAPPVNPCTPFPVIVQQMVRFKVLDMLTSVLKEFQVLKAEAGVHREDGDDPVLQTIAANLLQRKWMEFKQSDESWKEAPRALLDLGTIEKDIDAMVGMLKQGFGAGSIYSWMSSHLMQRPTVTGLPAHSAAAEFRTPAMGAMVREVHKELLAEEAHAQGGQDQAASKRAGELLDIIDKRFELWRKLDADVPPTFQPAGSHQGGAGGESSSDLADVLRGNIGRARQHDIYLAAIHVVEQWRELLQPPGEEDTDAWAARAQGGARQ